MPLFQERSFDRIQEARGGGTGFSHLRIRRSQSLFGRLTLTRFSSAEVPLSIGLILANLAVRDPPVPLKADTRTLAPCCTLHKPSTRVVFTPAKQAESLLVSVPLHRS
jgi:hypothetical protein